MKVIFIKDLKKQGKVNEIKEVSDGYATNYLIKNGYAVKYTKGSLDRLNNDLETNRIEEEKAIALAEQTKKAIEKLKIQFNVKTGANSKVFGNISTKQISDELKEKGYDIDKKKIIIDVPLNVLGNHFVEVELHKKVKAKLNIELISK